MARFSYISLLPQELLDNIFTRLDVKSVGQCKCVSKPWNFLISDPHFIKTHLTRTSLTNLILMSSVSEPDQVLYSVHFDINNHNCNGFASKLHFNLFKRWTKILGSYDGLILVEENHKGMFLLNPTTLDYKKLPLLNCGCGYRFSTMWNFLGFGYNSSCDDYVVVAICYEFCSEKDFCVYVYLLKENQWKKVGISPYSHKIKTSAAGIFVSGSLHWLATNWDDYNSWLISAYNIANEEFSQVPPPAGFSGLNLKSSRIGVLKGCLCLIRGVDYKTELWVMKTYGVVESWIKLSFALTDVTHIVSLDLQEDRLVMLEGGQFVFLVSNAKEVTLQDIKVLELPQDFRVGMTFVDSLVSPSKVENQKNP